MDYSDLLIKKASVDVEFFFAILSQFDVNTTNRCGVKLWKIRKQETTQMGGVP